MFSVSQVLTSNILQDPDANNACSEEKQQGSTLADITTERTIDMIKEDNHWDLKTVAAVEANADEVQLNASTLQ